MFCARGVGRQWEGGNGREPADTGSGGNPQTRGRGWLIQGVASINGHLCYMLASSAMMKAAQFWSDTDHKQTSNWNDATFMVRKVLKVPFLNAIIQSGSLSRYIISLHIYIYIYIFINEMFVHIGGWGCETHREIVPFHVMHACQ